MNRANITEERGTLGALLRLPYECLATRVYAELARSGFEEIRPAHGNVFRYISQEGSRITELAQRAGITKQSMAYLVEDLRHHGHVEIRPDPVDGRAKQVCLTERGHALQDRAMAISREVEAEWAAQMGEPAMATLRTLLTELKQSLQDNNPPP